MAQNLLKMTATITRSGQSRSKIYALMLEDRFPKPVKVDGSVLWVESEVDEWVSARIAERDRVWAESPNSPPMKRGRGRPPKQPPSPMPRRAEGVGQ